MGFSRDKKTREGSSVRRFLKHGGSWQNRWCYISCYQCWSITSIICCYFAKTLMWLCCIMYSVVLIVSVCGYNGHNRMSRYATPLNMARWQVPGKWQLLLYKPRQNTFLPNQTFFAELFSLDFKIRVCLFFKESLCGSCYINKIFNFLRCMEVLSGYYSDW